MQEPCFPTGAYRRRIRLVATEPGVVHAGLEDDFHYFEVVLRHDDEQVVACEGRARRWPWSTCVDALDTLHALAGMPLTTDSLAMAQWSNPRQHCTHQFDLTGFAVTHAARQQHGGAKTRQYDAEVPARAAFAASPQQARLSRDGAPVLTWTLHEERVLEPDPFTDAPWRRGFLRWAQERFAGDDEAIEAIFVLRRACEIANARGVDLSHVDTAAELSNGLKGTCYTMSVERMPVALRLHDAIRDYDSHPEDLLGAGP